ncbi:MAG: hypothetical protein N3C62_04470 [Synergistetes bacterium]|nr:hypothetical protein [Synergistota bacterium]MCX8127968.1 hypothetical protein [Synergistota bacterium]MDW8192837.1 hypothetical protein [Synergistota bacterium]
MEIKKLILMLLVVVFILNEVSPSYAEEVLAEIGAVNLLYIPEEAKVVGEGSVFIKHRDFKIWADKAVYLIEKGEIFAESALGKEIKVAHDSYVLYGKELYYNVFEKRGFLVRAKIEEKGINFKGEKVDFYITDKVPPRKIFFFKSAPKSLEKMGVEVSISKCSFTTCKLYKPSYYVSGSKVILYPDGTVRLVKPVLHFGGAEVLPLPFDYSFNVREEKFFLFVPVVGFTSALGWYGGIAFEGSSDSFPFNITLIYSERHGFVGRATGDMRLSEEARVSLDIERSEEWGNGKPKWRTELRFVEKEENFELSLAYIKDKKYWVLRDDEDIRVTYSAIPEIYAKYCLGSLLLFARWGDYEEKGISQNKLTLGSSLNLEKEIRENLLFDFEIVYLKDYYQNKLEREISYYQWVLKWRLKELSVLTGYMERKVFGKTPFYFDSYDPMRKYFVGVKYFSENLSLTSYFYYDDLKDNLRDLIVEISKSIGSRMFFSVKPWYYLDDGKWREIDYRVVYYLCPCGCTSMELGFHDDLRKENDDVLWVRFYVFPTSFSFVSGTLPERDSLIPR